MTGIIASASGGANNRGVYNSSSSPTMVNVTASASGPGGYGVYNASSSPTIHNSVLSGSRGIYNYATSGTYTVTVNNSQVTGSVYTITNDDNFTTLVGASLLSGGPVGDATGTMICAGVYDENYAWSDSTCP